MKKHLLVAASALVVGLGVSGGAFAGNGYGNGYGNGNSDPTNQQNGDAAVAASI